MSLNREIAEVLGWTVKHYTDMGPGFRYPEFFELFDPQGNVVSEYDTSYQTDVTQWGLEDYAWAHGPDYEHSLDALITTFGSHMVTLTLDNETNTATLRDYIENQMGDPAKEFHDHTDPHDLTGNAARVVYAWLKWKSQVEPKEED